MIKIIDGWYYEVDEFNYSLIHKYEREKGVFGTNEKTGEMKTVKEYIGHFRSMADMLIKLTRILAREKIAAGEIATIEEHIQALRTIKEQLLELVMPF